MENKKNESIKNEDDGPTFLSLEVLQLIKEAQMQHGIRHSDYQRYRQYCSRKLKRVRKVINFPQGNKYKVYREMIPEELVTEPRCLLIPLMNAERCWAYSMQLKYEANTEPRKNFHMLARLKKAVKHAHHLNSLSYEAAVPCDAKTTLEIQAYFAWMRGLLLFELQEFREALELLRTSKFICNKLCATLVGEAKDVYLAKCEEMNPNIKYLEYVIRGDTSAMEDLVKMRLHVGIEDPLTSKLDELIEKTRKKESASLSEVAWLGRTVAVKVPLVRKAITAALEQGEVVMAKVEGKKFDKKTPKQDATGVGEERLSVLEGILKLVIEAQQALKDEHKEDAGLKAVSTKSQLPEDKLSDAAYLFTYLIFLRQSTSIERSLLMIKQMKSSQDSKGKPQDYVRLYDVVIQNLSEIAACPSMHETLKDQVTNLATAYKAFKCFHLAEVMTELKRFADSMALFHRCLIYVAQVKTTSSFIDPQLAKISPAGEELSQLKDEAEVLRYSAHASCILDTPSDQAPSKPSTQDKSLVKHLHEFGGSSSSIKRLIDLPPAFEPVPAKPFFFDLAFSMIEFTPLDHLLEQKQAQSGITGYFKNWIWGASGDKVPS